MSVCKEIDCLFASAAQTLFNSGAAEKAVSRQNEFAHVQLGETAYETIVGPQGKEAARWGAAPANSQDCFSHRSASVSQTAGMEARASGLVHQTHPVGL